MSNLEFERDVIIYTDGDINIKTELAEPIQVSSKADKRSCTKLYDMSFAGFRSILYNNFQA